MKSCKIVAFLVAYIQRQKNFIVQGKENFGGESRCVTYFGPSLLSFSHAVQYGGGDGWNSISHLPMGLREKKIGAVLPQSWGK